VPAGSAPAGVGGTVIGVGGVVGAEFDAGVPGVEAEDELLEFDPELEFELMLLLALPAEKGFADPEPQPTIEPTAIAAALNLIKTLENCTVNSCQFGNATD